MLANKFSFLISKVYLNSSNLHRKYENRSDYFGIYKFILSFGCGMAHKDSHTITGIDYIFAYNFSWI